MRISSFPLRTLSVIALTLTASCCFATEYIVNGSSPRASDANPGTAARPFKTIFAAAARLNAGDTLTIHGGVYRESIAIKASGATARPIVIRSAPGETVVLTGADPLTGWTQVDDPKQRPLWMLSAPAGWPKDRFIAMDDHGPGPQLIMDGAILPRVGDPADLFPGSYCSDPDAGQITLWPAAPKAGAAALASNAAWWDSPPDPSSDDPNHHDVEGATRNTLLSIKGLHDIIVRGLTFRYNDASAQTGAFIIAPDNHGVICHDVTVQNCTIEYCHGRGLTMVGRNIDVEDSLFRFNGMVGVGGAVVGHSLFANNTLLGNTTSTISLGWESGGVKFMHSAGLVIRDCRFIENNGPGVWFDTGHSGNTIERNLCVANVGPGIMMEVSPDFDSTATDAHPIVDPYDVTMDPSLAGTTPAPNIIRNNIVVDSKQTSGILLQLASDCIVANNTVVGNANYGIFIRYHIYDKTGHRCIGNTLINNLCSDNGDAQIEITPDPLDKPGYVAGNVSDYNLFFYTPTWLASDPASHLPLVFPNRAQYGKWGKTQDGMNFSLEEWHAMRGYDAHSVQDDPCFVAPSMLDFHLQASSPAIAAGESTPYVTDDFYGRPRPAGRAPSIGAVEFLPDSDASLLMSH